MGDDAHCKHSRGRPDVCGSSVWW